MIRSNTTDNFINYPKLQKQNKEISTIFLLIFRRKIQSIELTKNETDKIIFVNIIRQYLQPLNKYMNFLVVD